MIFKSMKITLGELRLAIREALKEAKRTVKAPRLTKAQRTGLEPMPGDFDYEEKVPAGACSSCHRPMSDDEDPICTTHYCKRFGR